MDTGRDSVVTKPASSMAGQLPPCSERRPVRRRSPGMPVLVHDSICHRPGLLQPPRSSHQRGLRGSFWCCSSGGRQRGEASLVHRAILLISGSSLAAEGGHLPAGGGPPWFQQGTPARLRQARASTPSGGALPQRYQHLSAGQKGPPSGRRVNRRGTPDVRRTHCAVSRRNAWPQHGALPRRPAGRAPQQRGASARHARTAPSGAAAQGIHVQALPFPAPLLYYFLL